MPLIQLYGVGLQPFASGIAGSNSGGGMDVCCECCVLLSRVLQGSPTDCGAPLCVL